MTNPYSAQNAGAMPPRLPTKPTGWPIGSYDEYSLAQRAVDYLADNEFPVQDVTIVGVDLMMVERVTGRLTWPRVLGAGAASGAWFGLLIGVMLSLFTAPAGAGYLQILISLVLGVIFFVIFAAVSYASTRGSRDFQSASQLVAGRYDVLCHPRNAEKGRDLLAKLAMRPADGTA